MKHTVDCIWCVFLFGLDALLGNVVFVTWLDRLWLDSWLLDSHQSINHSRKLCHKVVLGWLCLWLRRFDATDISSNQCQRLVFFSTKPASLAKGKMRSDQAANQHCACICSHSVMLCVANSGSDRTNDYSWLCHGGCATVSIASSCSNQTLREACETWIGHLTGTVGPRGQVLSWQTNWHQVSWWTRNP